MEKYDVEWNWISEWSIHVANALRERLEVDGLLVKKHNNIDVYVVAMCDFN